jgi:hypothetical protein
MGVDREKIAKIVAWLKKDGHLERGKGERWVRKGELLDTSH